MYGKFGEDVDWKRRGYIAKGELLHSSEEVTEGMLGLATP
jgi:hypothetical protein